ncbi:TREH [Lepeophtheirus salmonis]|uniref:Trehalase n=1 Tax=Lepeophtheirus salmonis TaxID=72036 RepID=A0A7R8CJS7_LEPSM|nr:TREH [Lepeophtheirus salmonis]CAF2843830.1 TREH [Lepeophtheirus salmonis]
MDRDFVLFIYTNKTSSLIRMASIQSGLTTKINLEVSFRRSKKAFNDLEDHSKENLELFVEENFVNEEDTLLQYVPDDWSPFEPKDIIKSFNNYPEYSGFISEINNRMKSLCRKIDEDVLLNQQLYSLIYLPNPVIIPGGRFKEIYYWDSYWIIKGLLVCGMNTTVKGILENFLYMVKLFGHVPNGGRTYYIGRSQPPLLILMVKDYMDQTQDYDFVKENISILRNEFEYWVNKHLVLVEDDRGEMRKLFRFIDEDSTPRPESYFEDFDLVSSLELLPEKQKDLFRQLRTAAETGWDFSTRWYIDENGTNEGELKDTKADQILPILSMEILEAIDAILWNPSSGIWFDYDFMNKKSRNYFYPSNLTPLFLISDITSKIIDQSKIESALNYILEMDNEEIHPGGLPSSLIPSPQHGHVSYDATDPKSTGHGGEYLVQIGFGWTNGVLIGKKYYELNSRMKKIKNSLPSHLTLT